MSTVAPAPKPGKGRRKTRPLGVVRPPDGDGSTVPHDRRYTFHPAPRELCSDPKVSDQEFKLMAVLLNIGAFRAGGNRVMIWNTELAKMLGWTQRKTEDVLDKAEARLLIRREKVKAEKGTQGGRKYIEITWEPKDLYGQEEDASCLSHSGGSQEDSGSAYPTQVGHLSHSGGSQEAEVSHPSASTYPTQVGPLKNSSEEERRKNSAKNAVVDVDASASPGGESSTAPPAGEGEGEPYIPARFRMAARDRGGVPPGDDSDGEEEGEEPRAAGHRREAEALAVEIARREGRSAKAVGERDVRRAEEAMGLRDDGSGLPAGFNILPDPATAGAILRDSTATASRRYQKPTVRASGEDQIAGLQWNREFQARRNEGTLAAMRAWPFPHWRPPGQDEKDAAIEAARSEARSAGSPCPATAAQVPRPSAPRSEPPKRTGVYSDDWIAQCEANVAMGLAPPVWNILRSECPKWARDKIGALYADHPEWGPPPSLD